jgi:hypothetical protein
MLDTLALSDGLQPFSLPNDALPFGFDVDPLDGSNTLNVLRNNPLPLFSLPSSHHTDNQSVGIGVSSDVSFSNTDDWLADDYDSLLRHTRSPSPPPTEALGLL